MKKIIGYGILLGLLISLLKVIEYHFIVRDYALEIYVGLIALLFTVLGIWLGNKLTRPKQVTIYREVRVPQQEFQHDESKIKESGLSKRELEILMLMAEGHSNQEIADRLFVSLNTIKTHSSRLFAKLEVSRRTQAVQRAKTAGLIP